MDEETKRQVYNDLFKKLLSDMIDQIQRTHVLMVSTGLVDDKDAREGAAFLILVSSELLAACLGTLNGMGGLKDKELMLKQINNRLMEATKDESELTHDQG